MAPILHQPDWLPIRQVILFKNSFQDLIFSFWCTVQMSAWHGSVLLPVDILLVNLIARRGLDVHRLK